MPVSSIVQGVALGGVCNGTSSTLLCAAITNSAAHAASIKPNARPTQTQSPLGGLRFMVGVVAAPFRGFILLKQRGTGPDKFDLFGNIALSA